MKGIKQITIIAQDLPRAKRFYQETLGIQHLFSGGAGPTAMEFFQCGSVRILIGTPAGGHSHTSVVYFDVDDIQGKNRELKEKGVEFLHDAHMVARLPDREVWLAEFKDSEGNPMALMSEVKI